MDRRAAFSKLVLGAAGAVSFLQSDAAFADKVTDLEKVVEQETAEALKEKAALAQDRLVVDALEKTLGKLEAKELLEVSTEASLQQAIIMAKQKGDTGKVESLTADLQSWCLLTCRIRSRLQR